MDKKTWFTIPFLFIPKRATLCLKYSIILGEAPTSVCHFFRPSIRRAPYLRNCTSSNHSFWYTRVKCYLQVLFLFVCFCFFFFFCLFFWNLDFLEYYGCKRAKNSPKWKIITSVTHHISQEQYSIWSWFLVHLCKMMISTGCCCCCCCCLFSHFSEFFFRAARRMKGQKIA